MDGWFRRWMASRWGHLGPIFRCEIRIFKEGKSKLLLMVQKSGVHQLRLVVQYLQAFIHVRWWSPDFWTINSIVWNKEWFRSSSRWIGWHSRPWRVVTSQHFQKVVIYLVIVFRMITSLVQKYPGWSLSPCKILKMKPENHSWPFFEDKKTFSKTFIFEFKILAVFFRQGATSNFKPSYGPCITPASFGRLKNSSWSSMAAAILRRLRFGGVGLQHYMCQGPNSYYLTI